MKNQSNKYNAVPSQVFTPFKTTKKITTFFMFLSLILSAIMLFLVLSGKLSFTQDQLNEMADFTLNLVFVVAALGLTIFSLPLKNEHPEKIKSYLVT